MQTLRRWRFEVFLVALAAVELATVAGADVRHKPAALMITALSVAVLAGTRWQPLTAVVTAFALLTVSVAVMPRSTTAQFFGTLATFAIAGAVCTEREAVLAWLAGAGMLGYAAWVDPFGSGLPDFLLSLAFGSTMLGAGMLVARRGRHVAHVVEQAARAEADQQAATRRALAEERATIARELHDVVSHGLSVVVVQTVAARGVLGDVHDDAGAEVDRHLAAVETTARDALGEMRRMLGLLQADDDHAVDDEVAPAASLGQLDELLARIAPGRPQVCLDVDERLELPAGLELAIYRIIQEALTNVVKHAPGASVYVEIHQSGGRIVLRVVNGPGPQPPADPPLGAGRGLVGIRERAALYDATAAAAPTPDGGFAVTVTFPATAGESRRPITARPLS